MTTLRFRAGAQTVAWPACLLPRRFRPLDAVGQAVAVVRQGSISSIGRRVSL
jgi:hypothetical protein